MTTLAQSVRDHLRVANQSYARHWAFAWRFGAKLFGASLAAFVHGVAPFWFKSTAGDTVRQLYRSMAERHEKPGL